MFSPESFSFGSPKPKKPITRKPSSGSPKGNPPRYALGDKALSYNFKRGGAWYNSLKSKLNGSYLTSRSTADILNMCPRYNKLNNSARADFWISVFDALAYAESGHNPKTAYKESFGVVSRGLLQISHGSANGHRGYCAGSTSSNLHNPYKNLGCGVTIMTHQLQSRGQLLTQPSHYYWSVLNPQKNTGGYMRFRNRLAFLKWRGNPWPKACQ